MAKLYVSLSLRDGMFPDNAEMSKRAIGVQALQDFWWNANKEDRVNAIERSQEALFQAIQQRFLFSLPLSEAAKTLEMHLEHGDRLIVIEAQLPSFDDGEIRWAEAVENARITFSFWQVK